MNIKNIIVVAKSEDFYTVGFYKNYDISCHSLNSAEDLYTTDDFELACINANDKYVIYKNEIENGIMIVNQN